jgi:glucokinase
LRSQTSIAPGTGVGSAFLDDRLLVGSGPCVPPEGRVDLLRIDGRPLEDTVSSRAVVGRFTALAGSRVPVTGIREIAERARAGSADARTVLDASFAALGRALGPWITRFCPSVLVVGGSVTGAWDVISGSFARGLRDTAGPSLPDVRTAARPRDAALIGAASVVPQGR